jgi:hypothetical protein
VVFIDETGANTQMTRRQGRAWRGQRVVDKVPHGHWKTTTFVGALRVSGAMMTVSPGRSVGTNCCVGGRIASAGLVVAQNERVSLHPIRFLCEPLYTLFEKRLKRRLSLLNKEFAAILSVLC